MCFSLETMQKKMSFCAKLKKDIKKSILVDLLTFNCATTQGGATVSSCSVAMQKHACNTAKQACEDQAMCLRSGLFYNLSIKIDFL